jgi:hypothetical protein
VTDAAAARLRGLAALDDVLAGRVTRVAELRRAWPRDREALDFLLRRARQEAEHFLLTKGDLERSFVVLLRGFLERGGTPGELERAYDEAIRRAREGPEGGGTGRR